MFLKVVFAFIPLLPFSGLRQSVSGSGSMIVESRFKATWYGRIRRRRPPDCDLRICPKKVANQCAGGQASLRQSSLTDCTPLSTLLRQATAALEISRPEAKSDSNGSETPAMVSRDAKAQPPFTAFSGGLATGLLLSALLAAPFLIRSYKRQLGESLIQWGERFAARPHSQVQSTPPAPPPVSPLEQAMFSAPKEESPAPQKMVVTSRVVLPAATSLPRLPSDKLSPEQVKKTAKPQPAQIAPEMPTPATSTPTAAVAPKASGAVAAAAIATTASKTPLPAPPVAAGSDVIPTKPAPLSPLVPADRNRNIQKASAENSNAGSELYFEVGKFRNPVLAYRANDNLARLGFRATVVEKGLLWTNSYHVLVGPYADDKAEEIRKKLTSSGFKPRVFERGSRNLTIYGGCDAMGRLLHSARTPETCRCSWKTAPSVGKRTAPLRWLNLRKKIASLPQRTGSG